MFGAKSSPFQAQVCLAAACKKKIPNVYPLGSEIIQKVIHMDDSMHSVLLEDQGIELYKQFSLLLSKASMQARKRLSNSMKVIAQIPAQDRKAKVDLDHNELPCAKTLCVWWLAQENVFTFKENAPGGNTAFTKHELLKKIATLFDPLGLLAPYTIRAKILLQEMWTAGLEWDMNCPKR